jgi:hypothetical protein
MNLPTNRFGTNFAKAGLRRLGLVLLLALPLVATAVEQKTFATPDAAVEALIAALKANDEAALLAIFGDTHKKLVVTGDTANDAGARAKAARIWRHTGCSMSAAPIAGCC